MTYSSVATGETTIGAERFHFRVRNGIGWFPLANAARETLHNPEVLVLTPTPHDRFAGPADLAPAMNNQSTGSHPTQALADRLRLYGQASRAISTG